MAAARIDRLFHQAAADASTAPIGMNRRVEQEEVHVPIPRDIHESNEHVITRQRGNPCEAALERSLVAGFARAPRGAKQPIESCRIERVPTFISHRA